MVNALEYYVSLVVAAAAAAVPDSTALHDGACTADDGYVRAVPVLWAPSPELHGQHDVPDAHGAILLYTFANSRAATM